LVDIAVGSIPLLVGTSSGFIAKDDIRFWYRTIRRPRWEPPDALFGPIWTTLYATMGIALVSVVRTDRSDPGRALGLALFSLQLALNAAWSRIFFVKHDIRGALIDSVALWIAVAGTVAAFWRTRRRAGSLLLPYLAWVSFATLLSARMWRLNR